MVGAEIQVFGGPICQGPPPKIDLKPQTKFSAIDLFLVSHPLTILAASTLPQSIPNASWDHHIPIPSGGIEKWRSILKKVSRNSRRFHLSRRTKSLFQRHTLPIIIS